MLSGVQIAVIILVLAILVTIVFFGYFAKWEWTGLPQRTIKKANNEADVLPGRTAWDWLDLLIVPVILVLATFWLTSHQQMVQDKAEDSREKLQQKAEDSREELQRQTEEVRAQNAALQGYLEEMQQLIIEANLFHPDRTTEVTAQQPGAPGTHKTIPEAHLLARARTLTVLEELGPTQKRSVMQFLVESNLIDRGDDQDNLRSRDEPIVNLYGANLADAKLHDIVLYSTYLSKVNLQGARLNYADLRHSDLQKANLKEATLVGTKLYGAELKGADLTGANLKEAIVTDKQLSETKSLKSATMPDGTVYD